MKVRESGMPPEETWVSFFSPEATLRQLSFAVPNAVVVDFGCGYGTFAVAAARLGAASVFAFDIDPLMVEATRRKAAVQGLDNLLPIHRDFVSEGTGLDDASTDYVMLFNILHAEDPHSLLREARRVLRPGGSAAIMHWVSDRITPRGPPLAIRPTAEQCRTWARDRGFHVGEIVDLPPYHFGLIAHRPPWRS
jgi:SAM-dependent methyltransferase